MQMAASFTGQTSQQASNRRVVLGVAVSLAVHALFLLAYKNSQVGTFETALTEPVSIAVTILPPPPPPPPMLRAEPVAPGTPSTPAAPRTARRAPPRAVIAVPQNSAAEPEAFAVQQPETPAPTPAPAFNMDAARQVARANAHLRDPAKEGTALAQFPEPPLQTESALARGIAAAKRPNCKDGLPGGLLAPIYLLMEKKDSGCKW